MKKLLLLLIAVALVVGILITRPTDAGIPTCREAREAKYVGRCIASIDAFGVITGD